MNSKKNRMNRALIAMFDFENLNKLSLNKLSQYYSQLLNLHKEELNYKED